MDYYAGIDVSLEQSSVCVVDSSGTIVRETKVASEPIDPALKFVNGGLKVGHWAAPPSVRQDGLDAEHRKKA